MCKMELRKYLDSDPLSAVRMVEKLEIFLEHEKHGSFFKDFIYLI